MSRIQLINKVKYNPFIYGLYYKMGSFCLKVLRLFVRTNPKLIVFVSFGGRKYDDSPRAIYEEMLADNRCHTFEYVWGFIEPSLFDIPKGRKIRVDTPSYFVTLLKARCWVTNSGVERGLSFSGKNTFYLNTWHGTPIKLMGSDIHTGNNSFGSKSSLDALDVFLAQGEYDIDIFSRAFKIPKEKFRLTGLPRNDTLYNNNNEEFKTKIRSRLNISTDKKVILYAPTFREYQRDSKSNVVMSIPFDIASFAYNLGPDVVILLRAHYEVVKLLDINISTLPSVINVSDYPELNDLMLASDLLISDYSSLLFDYSIIGKPMISYSYDYELYTSSRGLYFDPRSYLPSSDNESDLLELTIAALKNPYPFEQKTMSFRKHFVNAYGSASKQCVSLILDAI